VPVKVIHYELRRKRRTLGGIWGAFFRAPVSEGIQDQFDSIGDAQLVIGAQQGFLDGVFLDAELLGNLAIADAFGNQIDDLFFARGQHTLSLGIDDTCGGCGAERVDNIPDLLGIGPVLTMKDDSNTAAKNAEPRTSRREATSGAPCVFQCVGPGCAF
jgi:hypothetical protein